MKLSDRNIPHKDIFYSTPISNKKITNSNSSKLLNIGKINLNSEEFSNNNNEKKHKIFNSFYSHEEELSSISHRGFDSEIYERLRKENVDFIKTLLRLKKKMYSQNSNFSNFQKNKKEKIENLKMKKNKNLDISPFEITNVKSINHQRDKPIKIKTSLRKLNYSENNTNKRKNIFNNKVENSSLKNSMNLEKKNGQLSPPNKPVKQRTISSITNKNYKMQEFFKEKKPTIKKNNKISPPSKKLIRVNTTGKINNRNPNKNILKKLKEKNNNPVPIAVINLFDNNENDIKTKSGDNKFHFGHKRIKTNY